MKSICRTLGWVMVAVLVLAASAAAKPGYGTLSGVVLDPSGTPQMGASVWLISEDAGGRIVAQILSNQYGAFFTDHLKPGNYAVRVSVAGFLPSMERHVAVMSNLTTLLRVQVDTVFSSLDTLRRKSDAPAEQDDWKWVLRSSTATRTILQWEDTGSQIASNHSGCGPSRRTAASRPGAGNERRIAARIRFESSECPRDRCFLRSTAWQPGTHVGCRPDELRPRSVRLICQRLASFRQCGKRP